ncbi:MAG: hypothetical protein Q8P24_21185, partial [Desulfobacterales bacterium]|nr:hypothetical protein [Desulfobacterales bacterium]
INGYLPQYLRWAPNFNPRNTPCIPPVEILARLDLAKTISFMDGHELGFTQKLIVPVDGLQLPVHG